MTPSDEELMMMVKKDNDTFAFDILVQRYKAPLLNFIYRFIGDQDIAQDISQDTFLRLWLSAKSYLPLAKFTTFLYTIAKNACLNSLEKINNDPEVQSLNENLSSNNDYDLQNAISNTDDSPDNELIKIEIGERIKNAIRRLSDEHRLVFILTEYEGLSYQDVATIIQCPVGTVASRKNSAVKQLRRYLEPFIK